MTATRHATERFDLLLEGATLITGYASQPLLRGDNLGLRDGHIAWIGMELPAGIQAEIKRYAQLVKSTNMKVE